MKNVRVVFEPGNIEIDIPAGSKIISAIEQSGIPFELPCGGKGICGKCRVKVIEGASSPNETEKKILGERVKRGWRLACQSRINSHSTIAVGSKSPSYHKILTSKILCNVSKNPQIRKQLLNIGSITLANPISLQEHVATHLNLQVENVNPLILKEIGTDAGPEQTVVFHNETPIAIEKGNTTSSCYGIGFDLGTTTMVLTIFNLIECKEAISVVRPNPQIKFGDDIISRIDFSLRNDGLDNLHKIIVDEINKMIDEATKLSGIKHNHIYEFAISGNTVMEQIFLNLPLNSLSKIPFNSLIKGPVEISAFKAGIHINPEGIVFVFPALGGFVGGDTTGLIFSTGI
ncbi:MAG TPA: 2Fe-2S iron-sulfur cluster-binding protein, partial [bacterium]|nr:2Fe-2S iron-sulfur cluster-binding protein [bacterium]